MKNRFCPCLALLLGLTLFSCKQTPTPAFDIGSNIHVDGYTPTQAILLSRHNIRAPLSDKDSLLGRLTPHEWYPWSAPASELSLRGGVLETEMGQYFRKWAESEGLFPSNHHPEEGEVRVYVNAKQRTIATAEYFVSGLLPSANFPIETHAPYDTMDPIFHPQFTFVSPKYCEDATAQIHELFDPDIQSLQSDYALLTDVLDYKNSPAYRNGEVGDLNVNDTTFTFELNKEPALKGSLKTACTASDALTLQYYEEPDLKKAAFGKDLSFDQWKSLSHIKDVYGDVLFSAPLISYNLAHPLLELLEGELSDPSRTFSFLVGHDSNLSSVLASLKTKDYVLPGSIEGRTPIGSKLVLTTFVNAKEEEYLRADLVYQNVDYLRSMPLMDLDTHPTVVPLRFQGLAVNEDGLYEKAGFLAHLHSAIEEYDHIKATYGIE